MAEPASTSAITLSVGSVAIAGKFLGMEYDQLLFGLFGALILLSKSEQTSRGAAFTNIGISMLSAGVGAPFISQLLLTYFDVLHKVDQDLLENGIAMAIGAGWQVALPTAWSWLKTKFGQ